jgi:hypothetical protein
MKVVTMTSDKWLKWLRWVVGIILVALVGIMVGGWQGTIVVGLLLVVLAVGIVVRKIMGAPSTDDLPPT